MHVRISVTSTPLFVCVCVWWCVWWERRVWFHPPSVNKITAEIASTPEWKNNPWQQCKVAQFYRENHTDLATLPAKVSTWVNINHHCCFFNDVWLAFTGEHPIYQLTWQMQMHVSKLYLIYFHIRMRPENQSENIGIHMLFSCLHVHESYPICATWEQNNWNLVTWTV